MRTSSELKVLQDSAKRWRGLSVLAGAVGLLSLTAVIGAYLAVLNGALPLGDWKPDPTLLAVGLLPVALPSLVLLSLSSAASAQAKATTALVHHLAVEQSTRLNRKLSSAPTDGPANW